MPNISLHNLFTSALLFVACLHQAYANTETQIRAYIKQKFAQDLIINDAQIEQLAWARAHVRPTPDMHLKRNRQSNLIEIDRALSRLYCAQLLRNGNRHAYNKFVAAQIAANETNVLSFATFSKLSKHLQNITAQDYNLLETAAILSAVSLSKPAAVLAQEAMSDLPTNDKMEFLANTLRNNSVIYPLLAQMLQNTDAAKNILYVLFPPQTNFRHMLYAEGGIGMFKYLRSMILHKFIDRKALDLWYAHWIINIAGFRGHVAQNGSIYLNEATAQAMQKVYMLVTHMLDAPNFDPLIPYLEYRAQLLGIGSLPRAERLFAAHLACMLRIYTPNGGKQLLVALQQFNADEIQAVKQYFAQGLIDINQIMHLHMPALLNNVLQVTNNDLEQALQLVLPTYNNIILAAKKQKNLPSISFDWLACSVSTKELMQKNTNISFAADGTVYLNQT